MLSTDTTFSFINNSKDFDYSNVRIWVFHRGRFYIPRLRMMLVAEIARFYRQKYEPSANEYGSAFTPVWSTILKIKRKYRKYKEIVIFHTPGLLAIKLMPEAFLLAAKGIKSVLVTGTNGKSTVTRMIHFGLKAAGVENFCNLSGCNLLGGVATSYLLNVSECGSKKKWAVIECDEAWTIDVAPVIHPEVMVVTNISSDQISRLKSPENVRLMIERAINDACPRYVVCDADIQLTVSNGVTKIVRFALDKNYSSVIPGEFNKLNVAAANKTLELLGFATKSSLDAVQKTQAPPGRMEFIAIDGHKTLLTLAKNSVGLSSNLDYIKTLEEKYKIFLLMNNNIGDDTSPDWLLSSSLSDSLTLMGCDVFVGGNLSAILLDFLHKKGVAHCHELPAMKSIPSIIRNSSVLTIIVANYSAMLSIRLMLAQEGIIENNRVNSTK